LEGVSVMKIIQGIIIFISVCILSSGVYSRESGLIGAGDNKDKYPLPDQYQVMVKNSGYYPESLWLETEKQAYLKILKEARAKVLIVPFQVQNYAVDRISRSLMTHHLSEIISSSTKLKVADSILVSRALGERNRVIERSDVYWLANEMQVDIIIWGYVGHKRDETLLLTLQTQQRIDDEAFSDRTPLSQMSWNQSVFSDENIPFDVFVGLKHEIKSFLPISMKKGRKPRIKKRMKRLDLPKSATAMYSDESDNPIESAYRYQLLGILVPARMTIARERFFIRSLVLLQHVSPKSPDYKTIKSRAYFYLNRRPAALALLEEHDQPEDKALLAILNGNIFDLELQIADIKSPLIKLLSQIELYDLKWKYEFGENNADEIDDIASNSPEWKDLIMRRLVDGYVWARHSNILVKKLLDKDVPVKGVTAEDILASVIALGDGKKESEEISFSVYEHVSALIKQEGDEWCCGQKGYGPYKKEYLYLLEAVGEDNLLRNVSFELNVQGSPERALALIEQYETVYGGHPMLSQLHAEALILLSKKKQGIAKKRMKKTAENLALEAYYLAAGQEEFALRASYFLIKEKRVVYPFYNSDYPRRWFWHNRIKDGDRVFGDENSIKDQIAGNYELSVRYSNSQFIKAVENYKLRSKGGVDEEETKLFLDKYRYRFNGHPERVSFIASLHEKNGDVDEAKEVLKAGIDKEPLNWESYYRLGWLYVQEERHEEASNLFLEYPPFNSKTSKNRVSLSNDSFKAASMLAMSGAFEEAIPLFRISADYKTGSSANLQSAEIVAKYDGNYGEAARYAAWRAKRYNEVKAYTNLMEYMYVFGYYDLAEAIFKSIVKKFPGVNVWRAAILGQRSEGKTDEEIMAWFRDSPYRDGLSEDNIVAHILELNINDRQVKENLPHIIEELVKAPSLKMDLPDLVEMYDDNSQGWVVVGPSEYFVKEKSNSLSGNEVPKSDFVYFAEGYNAIKLSDYHVAERIFGEYLRFYDDKMRRFKYVLPYLTWSSLKVGNHDVIKSYLESFSDDQQDYYYYYSMGLISGSQGDHESAINYFNKALKKPGKISGPISAGYLIVEMHEWLYLDSGEEVYRENLMEIVGLQSKLVPMVSLNYAVIAKYSKEKEERIKALAIAMYLDKGSERVSSFSEEDKKMANEWLENNNPFIITRLAKDEIEI